MIGILILIPLFLLLVEEIHTLYTGTEGVQRWTVDKCTNDSIVIELKWSVPFFGSKTMGHKCPPYFQIEGIIDAKGSVCKFHFSISTVSSIPKSFFSPLSPSELKELKEKEDKDTKKKKIDSSARSAAVTICNYTSRHLIRRDYALSCGQW